MSQDPGFCTNCHKEKMRAKHKQPRASWENLTGIASGNRGKQLKSIKNIGYPHENDNESHCANVNCSDGRDNILNSIDRVNKGLNHASRTGGWVKIDKEALEQLEQLSEKSNEVRNTREIDWLGSDRKKDWENIRDRIDKFENNRNRAIERTAEVANNPNREEQGKERIDECDEILDNLYELRNDIHIQEIISDHIDRITDRSNEQEVVVDEEASIRENEEDEQQERDEVSKEALQARIEDLEAENEELETENNDLNSKLDDRDETIEDLEAENEKLTDEKRALIDEKQALTDKIQDLTEDKMGLANKKQEMRNEKLDLREENLDLKEEVQHLRSKLQRLENERESEAGVEVTSERAGDGTKKGATEGVASDGDRAAGEDREEPRPSSSQTQAGDNGPNSGSQESDAILGDPIPEEYEQVFGKPMPEEYRNGGPTTNNGVDREDDRTERDDPETDREGDDESPAGGPGL